jgi:glycine/D-amino acid oxidase-like deaminating enzyme
LKVDVAVVGGGYTGLAAARRLASAGATVVVLEREHVGWGASSRNGGQVLTGLKLDPETLVSRYGEDKARQLFNASRDANAFLAALVKGEHIDCSYEVTGHIQAAWKPAHFELFRDEQAVLARVFNHHVDLVDRADQRSELGSDRYHGLLVDRGSANLNPAKYARGLAEAAIRSGARIAEKTNVENVERRGARWRVSTTAGALEAGDVLIGTDGYTGGVFPELRRRIVRVGSYIIATERLDGTTAARLLPTRRVAFDSKNFLYYFSVTPDRRLLFGGRAEFSDPTPTSARHAARILQRGMADVFPDLASARIDYAWGGAVAFTRDQMPRAGRLDGQYYSTGYFGHGIAMATYLGDLIARRIAGETVQHPLIDDNFASIPLYSGRPWFLPLVGAYYRAKDWLQ